MHHSADQQTHRPGPPPGAGDAQGTRRTFCSPCAGCTGTLAQSFVRDKCCWGEARVGEQQRQRREGWEAGRRACGGRPGSGRGHGPWQRSLPRRSALPASPASGFLRGFPSPLPPKEAPPPSAHSLPPSQLLPAWPLGLGTPLGDEEEQAAPGFQPQCPSAMAALRGPGWHSPDLPPPGWLWTGTPGSASQCSMCLPGPEGQGDLSTSLHSPAEPGEQRPCTCMTGELRQVTALS